MNLLTVKLQLGLPYRNAWISWSPPQVKIWSLMFLILLRRVCLGVWKFGQWRKKCVVVSPALPQSDNGFRISWKQCLNLWSQRWLRPRRNLVRSLIPFGLRILKILFVQGHVRFSRFFLKIERLPEFLILQSRLFHTDIVEGKNEFLKWIVSYMNYRNIIAMSAFTNSIQVINQIE